jgi:hypothetical protein
VRGDHKNAGIRHLGSDQVNPVQDICVVDLASNNKDGSIGKEDTLRLHQFARSRHVPGLELDQSLVVCLFINNDKSPVIERQAILSSSWRSGVRILGAKAR